MACMPLWHCHMPHTVAVRRVARGKGWTSCSDHLRAPEVAAAASGADLQCATALCSGLDADRALGLDAEDKGGCTASEPLRVHMMHDCGSLAQWKCQPGTGLLASTCCLPLQNGNHRKSRSCVKICWCNSDGRTRTYEQSHMRMHLCSPASCNSSGAEQALAQPAST
jgi:hypothetical protein